MKNKNTYSEFYKKFFDYVYMKALNKLEKNKKKQYHDEYTSFIQTPKDYIDLEVEDSAVKVSWYDNQSNYMIYVNIWDEDLEIKFKIKDKTVII